MSDYKQQPGDITVFKNNFKEQGDNKPDYKGKGLGLDGHEIEIALWVKEGKKGKFFSGRIQQAFEKAPSKPTPQAEFSKEDDDLPF